MEMKYQNRHEAGKILAKHLKKYSEKKDVIILALPRGGVPVGYEVAKALSVPLDVFIVRKLGVPFQEELAMGAIASHDALVLNDEIIQTLNISQSDIHKVMQSEKKELKRRENLYRGNRPALALQDKTVILIDDGIATGATMRAAILAIRTQNPQKIVMAVPVAAASTCEEMSPLVDELICPLMPTAFYAVGAWYENFSQTTDEEVSELLFDVAK